MRDVLGARIITFFHAHLRMVDEEIRTGRTPTPLLTSCELPTPGSPSIDAKTRMTEAYHPIFSGERFYKAVSRLTSLNLSRQLRDSCADNPWRERVRGPFDVLAAIFAAPTMRLT